MVNRIFYLLSMCAAAVAVAPACSYAETTSIPAPVNVYTHGYGPYAFAHKDGSITGPGVDMLSCALGKMDVDFQLNIVPLARARRLFTNKTLDIWFPTYHWKGRDNEKYIVGKLGTREISWYTLPGAELQPDHPDFKNKARIGTFARSGPEVMIQQAGYTLGKTTDDENQLVLWLLEGKVDALLTLDFRNLLSPRLKRRFGELRETYYETFRMGYEVAQHFDEKHPAFRAGFSKHLKLCELPPKHPEHDHEKDH